jgi:26S proteasome non-ATPase regulatory subunit 9
MTATTTSQDQLLKLIKRKDEIESELLAIAEELQSPGAEGQKPVGLKGNLVDKEGYPRNDIDIMRITTLRNRHAILNTDLGAIMKEIEKGLHTLHAANPTPSLPLKQDQELDEPFLRVNSCHPESPAFASGLREGDLITRFGALRKGEFSREGYPKVAEQVKEDKPIRVYAIRDGARKTFTVTPKKWSGQGLLGCHLVKSD